MYIIKKYNINFRTIFCAKPMEFFVHFRFALCSLEHNNQPPFLNHYIYIFNMINFAKIIYAKMTRLKLKQKHDPTSIFFLNK